MGAYPYALLEELGYICHPMMQVSDGHYVSVSYGKTRYDLSKATEGWLWRNTNYNRASPSNWFTNRPFESMFVAGSHHANPPIPHELAVLLTSRLEETIDRLANADKNKPKGNQ